MEWHRRRCALCEQVTNMVKLIGNKPYCDPDPEDEYKVNCYEIEAA